MPFTSPSISSIAAADTKAAYLYLTAKDLAALILQGRPITRAILTSHMAAHFGGSDAEGLWALRDAYDALEIAQVLVMLHPKNAFMGHSASDTLAALTLLAGQLPTQTFRSERQVDLQQFSTPLPLAWIAGRAADPTAGDLVLEPSAGTGMLAVHAHAAGAQLLLNERDPLRAGLLRSTFASEVTTHDAEFIHVHLAERARPDVILLNPPFVRSEARGRDAQAGARHLRSALLRLAPQGRCVAVDRRAKRTPLAG